MGSDAHPGLQEKERPKAPASLGFDLGSFEGAIEFELVVDSDEAARFLNINAKTLQKMARNGDVPAYRIGKLWKFRISDLDGWLRSKVISNCHSCRENERR